MIWRERKYFHSREPTMWKGEPFKGELAPFFKNKHSLSSQIRSQCVSLKYVQLKRYSVNKLPLLNWQNLILELIILEAVGSAVAITWEFFLYFTTNPHNGCPGRRDLWIHHCREVNWLQICPNSKCLLISPAKWNWIFITASMDG